MLTELESENVYKRIRDNKVIYNEDYHCPLLLRIMSDPSKARMTAFCSEIGIGESKFYDWCKQHPIFMQCYALGKIYAKEIWEREGENIKHYVSEPGTSNYLFEHWRMVGWARFKVGKNASIRLKLDPKGTPNEHYNQLIEQASEGDFTAGEIKQLMEAINVGLSAHTVFKLQEEINELKANLAVMSENSNGDNSSAVKRAKKED